SSSAAVEVAFVVAWRTLGGWSLSPEDVARLCRRVENEEIGVASGIMDPFAIVHGRAGHALLLDCRSLAWQPVRLPDDVAIVVADSGVRRGLGDTGYNRRREECAAAVEEIRRSVPGLRSLRDVSPPVLEGLEPALSLVSRRRARHVVEEIARVRSAVAALSRGDVATLGRAVADSHRSLRDLYEVSCPELDLLVEAAGAIGGCRGARLTGAGFGGCTLNLVDADRVEGFCERLAREYEAMTGRRAAVWLCRASDGAAVE
ncbi:MAG: galactokinase, partial [Candidatus Binatia bacterium]